MRPKLKDHSLKPTPHQQPSIFSGRTCQTGEPTRTTVEQPYYSTQCAVGYSLVHSNRSADQVKATRYHREASHYGAVLVPLNFHHDQRR